MPNTSDHTFHIPVLGVAFSVDAPAKVARYGISSVISLVDDGLLEGLRQHYCEQRGWEYHGIDANEADARARRTTAYLNVIKRIVDQDFERVRNGSFDDGDLPLYFELLPETSPLRQDYVRMRAESDHGKKQALQEDLRRRITPGSIDVNIMTKVDKANSTRQGVALPTEFNDAHASLRGFALSDLDSAVVLSAGMNPRLYSYCAQFDDFYPDATGALRKRLVIKVSDFRSALIQGKFMAKKGLWISEYRIESGLNCGGHAFATDGYLLGPILEEFLTRRDELLDAQRTLFAAAMRERGSAVRADDMHIDVTVQGGVGTAREHDFLMRRYAVSSVGWGSPFLLVPEVMNVDDNTLEKLRVAKSEDLYLSDISPLGVPFNNLRGNSKDLEKQELIDAGKPGSACVKKFLALNTELTEKPLCTASITYLKKKLALLREQHLEHTAEYRDAHAAATQKACLCEGLTVSALTVNGIDLKKMSSAVSVCPGPNLAYFSRISSLREMVDHIYGRLNIMTDPERPNMFIKELQLYIDYYQRLLDRNMGQLHDRVDSLQNKARTLLHEFHDNLMDGIAYYRGLIPEIREESEHMLERMRLELAALEQRLIELAPRHVFSQDASPVPAG
ncbi:MAG: hypothetical protein RBU27_04160 [Bacteroidota bacterium]|jgi:hypothetical protein|nr:hypothetical protein [Bacteroidota bacterium]